MKTILAIVAALFILGTVTRDTLGFVTFDSAQAVGYDMWTITVYIVGGWLIYRAFKKKPPTHLSNESK